MKITNRYVKGAGELHKKLLQLHQEAPAASAAAAYGAAQIIMTEARENAPVLEGWLQAGGYATKPTATSKGTASVDMGFGGAAEAYLVRQHEEHASKRHFFLRALQTKAKEAEAYMAKFMTEYFRTLMFRMPAKEVPETPTEEMGPVKTGVHGGVE